MNFDVVSIAQTLMKCPSVTGETLAVAQGFAQLTRYLEALGFKCHDLPFEGVQNLYARRGTTAPHVCFLGHMDVVPVGDRSAWLYDPFASVIKDGRLYGRGAVDMKGAIAAFVSAIASFDNQTSQSQHLQSQAFDDKASINIDARKKSMERRGSISFLITGDEEGVALHGTRRVLEWLQNRQEKIDCCVVGEPTSENFVGDTLKIGRRGSLSGKLVVHGTQGHIAYPENFDNPIPRLMRALTQMYQVVWDQGTHGFDPSHFEVTTIDVGNKASNVVPNQASARFNIRFNTCHNSDLLKARFQDMCRLHAGVGTYELDLTVSAEPFLTSSQDFAHQVKQAIAEVTGQGTKVSTSGGTSDARFIHTWCPVVELGLKNQTAHQVDEHVSLQDLKDLTKIYFSLLNKIFANDHMYQN